MQRLSLPKFLFSVFFFIFSVLGMSSFSYADNTPPSTNGNGEQEILSWLMTLDKNEIAAAKMALKKSDNSEVKKFANMMVQDHSKNLKEVARLLKLSKLKSVDTSQAKELKQKGKEEEKTLKKLSKADFDKAYMDAIINGHQEALSTLDNYLSQANPDMKSTEELKLTRDTVNEHLNQAKAIQNQLG